MTFKFYYYSIFLVFLSALISCKSAPIPPPKTEQAPPPPYVIEGKIYQPLNKVENYRETGIASWYGADFHGKKTSSGEPYDMYAETAAHRVLPFDTKVEVANLKNGRKTIVRINDRGPFIKDRIIDLSYTSAKEIGLVGPGTAPVEIKVIEAADTATSEWKGIFTVQVGAFKKQENALRLKEKIS